MKLQLFDTTDSHEATDDVKQTGRSSVTSATHPFSHEAMLHCHESVSQVV